LEFIAKPALKEADVKLSTKVSRIDTSTDTVKVFTDDGNELHYDDVVVTSPLGWLKTNKQAFVPSLPPRLSQAIDAIGYGCLEKVQSSS
jgi:monoamine oxidase